MNKKIRIKSTKLLEDKIVIQLCKNNLDWYEGHEVFLVYPYEDMERRRKCYEVIARLEISSVDENVILLIANDKTNVPLDDVELIIKERLKENKPVFVNQIEWW